MSSRFCRFLFPLLACVALVSDATVASATEIRTGFVERVYHDAAGDHKYTLFVPASYTPGRKWPVILFLHGAGARGDDNRLQLETCLAPQVRVRAATFPFLVVFPQCEDLTSRLLYGWQPDTTDGQRALAILDEVERDYQVDKSREILTGVSMGGFGTWSLGALQPNRWSALLVVAGGGDKPEVARRLKNVPVWVIHSANDPGVPIENEKRMIAQAREAGGRVYFTQLTATRHDVGYLVYGDDAVYEWMLNPQSKPNVEGLVRNSKRPPSSADLIDSRRPFIPGVEVPEAAFIRLDKSGLEAISFALPGLVPPDAVAGTAAGVHETKRAFMMSFDVNVSGVNYRGTVEQVTLTTREDGWATLGLGLRNLTMEIGSTQVTGRIVSASAGPMQIVIGQRGPVWLLVDVRPYIEQKRFRFELGESQFRIPDDDYYVSTPQVSARGLPFLRGRMANSVSSELVKGAYGRKSEIESQVTLAVPALVRRAEQMLEQRISEPRTFASWPNPKNQPRFKLWPNRLRVDESGLSLVVGMTVAKREMNPKPGPVRRLERSTVNFDTVPHKEGLQFGISGAVPEAFTLAGADTPIAVVDARDLPVSDFATLSNRQRVVEAIPDLARYGDRLQVRALVRATAPFDFTSVRPKGGLAPRTANTIARSILTDEMMFQFHGVRVSIEIKTSADDPRWTPCADFDIRLRQVFRIHVDRPSFESRTIHIEQPVPAELEIAGRFADGYVANDPVLYSQRIAGQFESAWRAAGNLAILRHLPVPEVSFGTAKLRVAELGWSDPFLMINFAPARTRITNHGQEPLVYSVRGPLSSWGGPYTLPPGKSHDYPVPYPVTVQTMTEAGEKTLNLPMGTHFVVNPNSQQPHAPSLASSSAANARRE